ncbi:ATP-binding cassette domain-containing protein [Phytomonospora endophytica]|uniref:ATP-binding cassette subfamily B protein n=1 Tax=Phytomonospora endophytica TaxID=714109 RepID=A0A841FED1_9ACTN|nr:ABC transporter ATP-binding protein [Phytomonospora endophytica]MBB6034626.1 ATP-binding cassette subfamily B protein [Phytomonospora endophytica]GIG71314.1 ABC transporter ATP-binding protein [Phytomonospora endophytica]
MPATTARLTHLFTRHWPRFTLQVGFALLIRVAVISSGLLLKVVFDRLAGGGAVWLPLAALAAVNLAWTTLWFDLSMARFEVRYIERVAAGLRTSTLAGILRRPAAAATEHEIGDVVDRFGRDVSELRILPAWTANNVGRLAGVLPVLAIMLAISPVVTLGVALPFALVVAVARMFDGRVRRQRGASREAAAEVGSIIGETVRAAATVRALGHREHAVARLRELGRRRERIAVREQTSTQIQSVVYHFAMNVAAGLVMVLAAKELAAGTLTIGDMALFVFFAAELGEVVALGGVLRQRFRQARVSLDRLAELAAPAPVTAPTRTWLRTPPPEPRRDTGPAEPLGSLRVRGLACRHASGGGVDGLDLDLTPGSLTVLTGAVGTGKTTALRAILGLLPRQSGAVRWNGTEIEPAEFLIAPRIGYVPQVPHLFTGTVADNVRLGAGGDIEQAVGVAVLSADLDTLPEGADTLIGVGGRRLSGGQAQRVALARALQREPALLVLDDVDSALDAVTARELWERLLGGDRTILAVSHNPYALGRATRVITLG